MSRRHFVPLLGAVAIILAGAAFLREAPAPHVKIAALRGLAPPSRDTGDQKLVGTGRTGWGVSVHYQANTDWEIVAPRMDAELKALGFARRFTLRKNGANWERADLVIYAQTHWTRETGNRLSDVVITRPAVPGEVVRAWIEDRLQRWRQP